MTLDQVKAALAPFAKFAELFTHNVLGVNHDNFFSKDITVNGEYKEFKITGADFDRAKDAFDFLNGIDPSKRPEAPPAPKEGEQVTELTGSSEQKSSDDPAHNEPAAPAGVEPEKLDEAMAQRDATAPAPGETVKKGRSK